MMTNEEAKNLEENIKKHIDIVLEHMDEKFAVMFEDQKIVKDNVKGIKQDVELLKEDMDFVKSNLADKNERFREIDAAADNHEKRIVKLENAILAEA